MTLTEKWKKGKLPEGFYYVKDGENIIAEYIDGYFYNNGQPMTSFSGGVDEVLAPVPSYEEYSRLEWYAGCGPDRIVELNKENRQLKELLKECREILEDITEHTDYNEVGIEKLLTKIDNAIGEK